MGDEDESYLISELRPFEALLSTAQGHLDRLYGPYGDSALLQATVVHDPINAARPVIEAIAQRIGGPFEEELVTYLEVSNWSAAKGVVLRMISAIEQQEKIARIREPQGPNLSVTKMHPAVWGSAKHLWAGDHDRAALQTASATVFDGLLPAALDVAKGSPSPEPATPSA